MTTKNSDKACVALNRDAIAAVDAKLHSGPQALERFSQLMRRAVTTPKSAIDEAARREAESNAGKPKRGPKPKTA